MVGTGKKILTEQEYELYLLIEKKNLLEKYPQYIENLYELNDHCSVTADLSGLFDGYQEPIFFDIGHVGPKGNEIIANKMFELSLPIIIENIEQIEFKENYKDSSLQKIDSSLISDEENILEEFYFTLQDIILPYKTPKVFPLIFKQ